MDRAGGTGELADSGTTRMAKSTTYRRRERPYAVSDRQGAGGPGREAAWPTTLMAVGVLAIIVLYWLVGTRTLVPYDVLFRWFVLFAFVGNLLPLKWAAMPLRMDRLEWLWFNLLAVGPLVFGAGLLLNFAFHGPVQHMLVQQGERFDLYGYWQQERSLPPHLPWPADFGQNPEKDRVALATTGPGDKVYGLAEGLLGYLVITDESAVRGK